MSKQTEEMTCVFKAIAGDNENLLTVLTKTTNELFEMFPNLTQIGLSLLVSEPSARNQEFCRLFLKSLSAKNVSEMETVQTDPIAEHIFEKVEHAKKASFALNSVFNKFIDLYYDLKDLLCAPNNKAVILFFKLLIESLLDSFAIIEYEYKPVVIEPGPSKHMNSSKT